MATWGADATVDLTTEVAFGDDPWETSPTWVDVSSRVRNIQTSRGASSETLRFAPGRMTITFANADRAFDPDYSAGPYFGTILPMKRIRVTATRSAVTFTVFLGWVTGWVQDWQVGDGVAYADCVDGGYAVANEELALSAYAAEVLTDSPSSYWYLNDVADLRDEVGGVTLVADTSGESTLSKNHVNPQNVEFTYPLGQGTYTYDADIEGATLPSMPRAIEFWVGPSPSAFFDIGTSTTQGWTFTVDASGLSDLNYSNSTDSRSKSSTDFAGGTMGQHGLPSHVVVQADTTNVYVYVNGELASQVALALGTSPVHSAGITITTGSAFSVTNAGVSHVAFYSAVLGADRIQAHYLAGLTAYGHPYGESCGERIARVLDEIGHPSNLRDVSKGGTIQGPYLPAGRTAMDYIDTVLPSEQGLFFFDVNGKLTFRDRAWQWISADADGVIFSDDGSNVGYWEGSPNSGTIDTVRNIVTVSYSDVGGITNRDTASVTAYGASREFIDGPTIRNGTDASNLGKYILRLKKDPQSIIPSLLVKMRSSMAANFAPVLGLELGEVVTVERTPMGVGSQIVRRHQVNGVSHRITPDNWETRFYLSPAVPMADEVPYFTVAHATYGRVGAPAGNKIPG